MVILILLFPFKAQIVFLLKHYIDFDSSYLFCLFGNFNLLKLVG